MAVSWLGFCLNARDYVEKLELWLEIKNGRLTNPGREGSSILPPTDLLIPVVLGQAGSASQPITWSAEAKLGNVQVPLETRSA